MFDKLSKTQPIGRMATPQEIAQLVFIYVRMRLLLLPVAITQLMVDLQNSITNTYETNTF